MDNKTPTDSLVRTQNYETNIVFCCIQMWADRD